MEHQPLSEQPKSRKTKSRQRKVNASKWQPDGETAKLKEDGISSTLNTREGSLETKELHHREAHQMRLNSSNEPTKRIDSREKDPNQEEINVDLDLVTNMVTRRGQQAIQKYQEGRANNNLSNDLVDANKSRQKLFVEHVSGRFSLKSVNSTCYLSRQDGQAGKSNSQKGSMYGEKLPIKVSTKTQTNLESANQTGYGMLPGQPLQQQEEMDNPMRNYGFHEFIPERLTDMRFNNCRSYDNLYLEGQNQLAYHNIYVPKLKIKQTDKSEKRAPTKKGKSPEQGIGFESATSVAYYAGNRIRNLRERIQTRQTKNSLQFTVKLMNQKRIKNADQAKQPTAETKNSQQFVIESQPMIANNTIDANYVTFLKPSNKSNFKEADEQVKVRDHPIFINDGSGSSMTVTTPDPMETNDYNHLGVKYNGEKGGGCIDANVLNGPATHALSTLNHSQQQPSAIAVTPSLNKSGKGKQEKMHRATNIDKIIESRQKSMKIKEEEYHEQEHAAEPHRNAEQDNKGEADETSKTLSPPLLDTKTKTSPAIPSQLRTNNVNESVTLSKPSNQVSNMQLTKPHSISQQILPRFSSENKNVVQVVTRAAPPASFNKKNKGGDGSSTGTEQEKHFLKSMAGINQSNQMETKSRFQAIKMANTTSSTGFPNVANRSPRKSYLAKQQMIKRNLSLKDNSLYASTEEKSKTGIKFNIDQVISGLEQKSDGNGLEMDITSREAAQQLAKISSRDNAQHQAKNASWQVQRCHIRQNQDIAKFDSTGSFTRHLIPVDVNTKYSESNQSRMRAVENKQSVVFRDPSVYYDAIKSYEFPIRMGRRKTRDAQSRNTEVKSNTVGPESSMTFICDEIVNLPIGLANQNLPMDQMYARERIDSMKNDQFGYGIRNYDFDRYFKQQKSTDELKVLRGPTPQQENYYPFRGKTEQVTRLTTPFTPFESNFRLQANNQSVHQQTKQTQHQISSIMMNTMNALKQQASRNSGSTWTQLDKDHQTQLMPQYQQSMAAFGYAKTAKFAFSKPDTDPLNINNPQKYQSMLLLQQSQSVGSISTQNIKPVLLIQNGQSRLVKPGDEVRRTSTLFQRQCDQVFEALQQKEAASAILSQAAKRKDTVVLEHSQPAAMPTKQAYDFRPKVVKKAEEEAALRKANDLSEKKAGKLKPTPEILITRNQSQLSDASQTKNQVSQMTVGTDEINSNQQSEQEQKQIEMNGTDEAENSQDQNESYEQYYKASSDISPHNIVIVPEEEVLTKQQQSIQEYQTPVLADSVDPQKITISVSVVSKQPEYLPHPPFHLKEREMTAFEKDVKFKEQNSIFNYEGEENPFARDKENRSANTQQTPARQTRSNFQKKRIEKSCNAGDELHEKRGVFSQYQRSHLIDPSIEGKFEPVMRLDSMSNQSKGHGGIQNSIERAEVPQQPFKEFDYYQKYSLNRLINQAANINHLEQPGGMLSQSAVPPRNHLINYHSEKANMNIMDKVNMNYSKFNEHSRLTIDAKQEQEPTQIFKHPASCAVFCSGNSANQAKPKSTTSKKQGTTPLKSSGAPSNMVIRGNQAPRKSFPSNKHALLDDQQPSQ